MKKSIGFLKTTAIGGLVFLLPLILIGVLIGKIVPIILQVAEALGPWIPIQSPFKIALLILLTIVSILLLCFAIGLLAKHSLAKQLSVAFEKKILLLFPRYAIYKDQMAGTIGGDVAKPRMKPVLARFSDSMRIGFELERNQEGLVTIYLPSAPDAWSGTVVLLNAQHVQPLDASFAETVSTFEKLGRDSIALLGPVSNQSDIPNRPDYGVRPKSGNE